MFDDCNNRDIQEYREFREANKRMFEEFNENIYAKRTFKSFPTQAEQSSISKIEPDKYLIKIICLRGAYQDGAFSYYLCTLTSNKPEVRLLKLPTIDKKDGQIYQGKRSILSGGGRYDPDKRELTNRFKSAGHGGCGEEAVWIFENDEFVLKKLIAQHNCNTRLPWEQISP